MVFQPSEMILTAGPSITSRELGYVVDAAQNGWNFHFKNYLGKFEKALANYVGTDHCVGMSSGTAALHVGLKLLGVGEGDEVIMPDLTFVSCANAVRFLGGTPVFVDVDPDTWCIDIDAMEMAITPKTKVIMPVWMYGQAPRMDELMDVFHRKCVANDTNGWVLEDACPALGTIYKGKKAGSWGHVSAFSFQGAKIAVMGEGGALLTNYGSFDKKARSLYSHGRDFDKEFWHSEVGFMYRLSNLQAALGLAQVERIEELAAKKRQIFQWYKDRLGDLDCITMNADQPEARLNYWMPSIVLQRSSLSRDELRSALKEKLIDTRPFFYPISKFSMYENCPRGNNRFSYYLGHHGINLPSGVWLDEERVDYIACNIRELLTRKAVS